MNKLPSPPPLSIKLIALFFMIIAVIIAVGILLSLLGSATVRSSLLPYVFVATLCGVTSVGLWFTQEWARRLAIGLLSCLLLSLLTVAIIYVVAHPPNAVYIGELAGRGLDRFTQFVAWLGVFYLISMVLVYVALVSAVYVQLWFLIKRKSAFVKPRQSV